MYKRGLGAFVILATAAFSQEMPADYAGVLKTLGKQELRHLAYQVCVVRGFFFLHTD